jgi:hypothetical protein
MNVKKMYGIASLIAVASSRPMHTKINNRHISFRKLRTPVKYIFNWVTTTPVNVTSSTFPDKTNPTTSMRATRRRAIGCGWLESVPPPQSHNAIENELPCLGPNARGLHYPDHRLSQRVWSRESPVTIVHHSKVRYGTRYTTYGQGKWASFDLGRWR